jgi:hypothetical protein
MITRVCFGLVAAAGIASSSWAADLTADQVQDGSPLVPGAHVTIEGGVRVIRPEPLDTGPNAMQQADTTGSLLYRGAAFYRVPSEKPPKVGQTGANKSPLKPSAH